MIFRAVAMLAIGGALAGYVTSLVLPRRYVAHGTIAVSNLALISGAADRALSPGFLSAFVAQEPHYQPILNYTPMEEIVDQIRKDTVIAPEGPRTCAIRFTDDDRYTAIATTETLMEQLRRDLGNAKVKDPVVVGMSGPSAALCALEGMAAGLVLSLGVVLTAARRS